MSKERERERERFCSFHVIFALFFSVIKYVYTYVVYMEIEGGALGSYAANQFIALLHNERGLGRFSNISFVY